MAATGRWGGTGNDGWGQTWVSCLRGRVSKGMGGSAKLVVLGDLYPCVFSEF